METDSSASASGSEDEERVMIRDELKSLSFEELLKLKEDIGTKAYSSSIFKPLSRNQAPVSTNRATDVFTRTNKNRPREESSKLPVRSNLRVGKVEKARPRDPRFDSLCGQFNQTAFLQNYKFVNSIRDKELNKLQALHRKEKNQERKAQIKVALERMKNQKKSLQERESKMLEKQSQRERNLHLIKEGKKPHFRRKGEKKAMHLIEKYEKLKADGKLEKYVKKKNKEQARKTSFK